MKRLLISCLLLVLLSCQWAGEKAKAGINKTGEVVGQAGSEFADGVKNGVKETFEDKASLGPGLQAKGLRLGKVLNASEAKAKTLSAYFIFNNDFSDTVTAVVFDEKGVEYGRAMSPVAGKTGQAAYFDFSFDARTDFGYRGRIIFQ